MWSLERVRPQNILIVNITRLTSPLFDIPLDECCLCVISPFDRGQPDELNDYQEDVSAGMRFVWGIMRRASRVCV